MSENFKLYEVVLRGMSSGTGTIYGRSYVVAKDSHRAYQIVREFLDKKDIGFDSDREMKEVGLLAENAEYPNCKTILFLQELGKTINEE